MRWETANEAPDRNKVFEFDLLNTEDRGRLITNRFETEGRTERTASSSRLGKNGPTGVQPR